MLVLNHSEVVSLLSVRDCVTAMREAMASFARGAVYQPLRMIVRPPAASGFLGLMPAFNREEGGALGIKVVSIFPDNPLRGLDAHQGAVLLFSPDTGEVLAVFNASAITAIRTAAVSGVATDLLAPENAGELAIIGSGVQARTHLEAMAAVRPLRLVRVASRTFEHAEELAKSLQGNYPFPIEAVKGPEAAMRGADLIVTVTTSLEPVVKRQWISDGAHINAVGSSTRLAREIDTATVKASTLFVDCRESAENEAGEYVIAKSEGAISSDHIRGELGEVLIGSRHGRTSREEITLFKSVGMAAEDLAAASYLYSKALSLGAGVDVAF
jgi:ornithine cyclodeaminase/alanine dehydrogenase-like protein (mu-crystallin family)